MKRTPSRRLFGAATTALLVLASLGIGSAGAANPKWDIVITPTPNKVGAGDGQDAGFVITVVNNGPSQINDLSVTIEATDTPTAAPTYISPLVLSTNGVPNGTVLDCAIASPQTCQLGTFSDDVSTTFTIAYAVPAGLTGNFDLKVSIRAGTGDTGSDGGASRGDAYSETGRATIGSGDFDGGFVVGADVYQTNPSLGNKNIQATRLELAQNLVPVMIEDGIASLAACDSVADDPDCTGLFGEWTALNVNNGNGGVDFASAFKVTLLVRGGPGGGSAEDIVIVHVLDDGTIETITETCTFGTDGAPTNAECLVATKSGSVWTIEVWLLKNGSIRGGI